MSEWKKVKLGDILQVKKGEYITKKEAHDGIYPVILGGKEPAYYIDKYNHTGKAIAISRSGASAGYVSFWNEPIFVTDGFLIEPKDTLTYEFLYYALKSKQSLLHNAQKGAAIPHVTPSLIGDIDFFLPSADTQPRHHHRDIIKCLAIIKEFALNGWSSLKFITANKYPLCL